MAYNCGYEISFPLVTTPILPLVVSSRRQLLISAGRYVPCSLPTSLPTKVDFQGIKNMLSFHGVVEAVREPPMLDSIQTICIFVCRTRPAFHLKRPVKKQPDTPGNHIVQSPGFFTPCILLISRLYPALGKSTTVGTTIRFAAPSRTKA